MTNRLISARLKPGLVTTIQNGIQASPQQAEEWYSEVQAQAHVLAYAQLHDLQEVVFHFARTSQLPPV